MSQIKRSVIMFVALFYPILYLTSILNLKEIFFKKLKDHLNIPKYYVNVHCITLRNIEMVCI